MIIEKNPADLSVTLVNSQDTNTMVPNLLNSKILWSSHYGLKHNKTASFLLEKYHFLIPVGLPTLNSVLLMTTSNCIKIQLFAGFYSMTKGQHNFSHNLNSLAFINIYLV